MASGAVAVKGASLEEVLRFVWVLPWTFTGTDLE